MTVQKILSQLPSVDLLLNQPQIQTLEKKYIRDLVKSRLQKNDGPFLISTLQPVRHKTGDTVMLYADLSQTNTAAIAEVISAYKTHMLDNQLTEMERFSNLRTFLLNVMLDADDYIKILNVAIAETF